jgi:transposase
MTLTHTLGIDIAKAKFDVALHLIRQTPSQIAQASTLNKYHLKDKTAQFTNDAAGFDELIVWLGTHRVGLESIHVAMEATGIYYEDLAVFLCAKGFKVS